ncbi:MAG: glycosyltransferase [Candidatus Ancillula sp.]|jgi:cellulose synthase/poly-beta-1,6-N-acetylglucosamine synthase-like glycosyltransferase|nr:glycosyltransferase [Candidatus Ancillula sp.]
MHNLLDLVGPICVDIASIMFAIFLSYVTILLISFSFRKDDVSGNPSDFEWHFLIPCRDEEAVIGKTLQYLYSNFPYAYMWVIDDDSDDSTASIVENFAKNASSRINVVYRKLPNARTGKAHALNDAWFKVKESMISRNVDFNKAVVAVVDADGLPSKNFTAICANSRLFGNPEIGAVQVEVRMSNRNDEPPEKGTPAASKYFTKRTMKLLVRMQDIEFRESISAMQISRKYVGTTSIGGNGQLTRASALESIVDEKGPWKGSLLEDFELGLHLLLAGWVNGYTFSAWVDQEALYSPSRFIHQRARWAQGTMQCIKYVPELVKSAKIWRPGLIEILYFMVQPWLQVCATIIYPIALLYEFFELDMLQVLAGLESERNAVQFLTILLIGMLEFGVFGLYYHFNTDETTYVFDAYFWGCLYFFYNFLIYPIACKALYNLIKKETGWAKTVRNAESSVIVTKYS